MVMQTLKQDVTVKRSKNPYIYAGLGLIILVGLSLNFLQNEETRLEKSELQMGKVERGPIVREIRAPGRFVPISETWITARVDARVKTKHLEPGALVKPETIIWQQV